MAQTLCLCQFACLSREAAVQGSDLDSHAKQWRLFADCFNNVGEPRPSHHIPSALGGTGIVWRAKALPLSQHLVKRKRSHEAFASSALAWDVLSRISNARVLEPSKALAGSAGYALELASPAFPSAFLLLACLGSVARAITGKAFSVACL